MDLYALDRDLARTGIITEFESLVWTSYAWEHSKATLRCPWDAVAASAVFLQRSDSDEVMMVTRRNAVAARDGASLTLECRGGTILLDGRVNWWTNTYNGVNLATAVADLIADAIATQQGITRTIPGLVTLSDETVSAHNIDIQISWNTCAEAIYELVRAARFVFGMRYAAGGLQPFLRRGTDRSADVLFSDEFLDVAQASMDRDDADYANLAVIGGEGEGALRTVTTLRIDETRELVETWVDARDLAKDAMTDPQYLAVLQMRGARDLAEATATCSFEAAVTEDRYRYGGDYELGDTVAYRALGLEGTDMITGVAETFEGGDRTLDIELGKTAPTVRQLVDRR